EAAHVEPVVGRVVDEQLAAAAALPAGLDAIDLERHARAFVLRDAEEACELGLIGALAIGVVRAAHDAAQAAIARDLARGCNGDPSGPHAALGVDDHAIADRVVAVAGIAPREAAGGDEAHAGDVRD